MILTQRPTSLPDLRQQPISPVTTTPGLELLSTIMLAPQGITYTSWNPSIIELDAPTSFGKYHTFLFQISGLGFNTSSVSLNLDIRRNATVNSITSRSLQFWSPTGTASLAYSNPGGTSGSQPISSAVLTTDQYARDIEIYFSQSGVNTIFRVGSDTTLITNGIWFSTQAFNFGAVASSEAYGFNTTPGIKLAPSSGTFNVPAYPGGAYVLTSFRVECRIYGWRR